MLLHPSKGQRAGHIRAGGRGPRNGMPALPWRMAGRRLGISRTGSSPTGKGPYPSGSGPYLRGTSTIPSGEEGCAWEGPRRPRREWARTREGSPSPGLLCLRPAFPGDGFPRFFDGLGMRRGSEGLTHAVSSLLGRRPFEIERQQALQDLLVTPEALCLSLHPSVLL
jgi:hypothetical protein